MRKYLGYPKHNHNEVDPWDGGMTPMLILGLIEGEKFKAADRAEKRACWRWAQRPDGSGSYLFGADGDPPDSFIKKSWLTGGPSQA